VTSRRLWVRNLVWMAPAAFAAVVGSPYALVVILSVLATLAVVVRVADQILEDRSQPPPRPRRSAFAAAAAPRPVPVARPPADLRRMETLVGARTVTAAGVHFWLRPLLVDLVASRLGRQGDARLEDPATAASIADPLWAVVRPDRDAPGHRDAPGLSLADLARAVDQLEAL
jgi:hypothetical protein